MTETQLEIPIQLLTTEEAARRLAVSIHWLKASRYRPELDGPKFVRFSRIVRYDVRDLDQWIELRKFRGTYELTDRRER